MKIRFLFALIGLAIGFALPTFAQQKDTPDPVLREKLVAAVKKHTDALDKNDAACRCRELHRGRGQCGARLTDFWSGRYRETLGRQVPESAIQQ